MKQRYMTLGGKYTRVCGRDKRNTRTATERKSLSSSKKDERFRKSTEHCQRIYRMIGTRSFAQLILVYTDRPSNMVQRILGQKPANIADTCLSSSDRTGVMKASTSSNTVTTPFPNCSGWYVISHKRVSSG